jgi:hypothetical protein
MEPALAIDGKPHAPDPAASTRGSTVGSDGNIWVGDE